MTLGRRLFQSLWSGRYALRLTRPTPLQQPSLILVCVGHVAPAAVVRLPSTSVGVDLSEGLVEISSAAKCRHPVAPVLAPNPLAPACLPPLCWPRGDDKRRSADEAQRQRY